MTKLTLAGLLAGSCLLGSATGLRAQDGPPPGGFDPAQMRQRMLDRLHDQLEVKDEAEWKLIAERIQKVMEARRALGGPGGPGGPGGFNRTPPPEIQALRKALDAKASPAELKTKLAEVRAAREQKEADLAKAQDELKQLLSVRQEAVAVLFGLVK